MGVYRSQLTVKKLHELGIDNLSDGPAGTWTLTVKAGTFEMHCQPIADAVTDCGNANLASLKVNSLMDLGDLRGRGPTVWFVDDMELKAKLTGCIAHSEADGGCGPDVLTHMKWRKVPQGLVFSDYGLGSDPGTSNSMTVQMWTRIS